MEREELAVLLPISDGGITKMEQPLIEGRNRKYIKPVGIDELIDQPNFEGANVTRVEPDILEYVRKQMHRATVTCEVVGQAILFQEEMDREMRIIEAELTSKTGEEALEEARG